jgi:hypothetical protein
VHLFSPGFCAAQEGGQIAQPTCRPRLFKYVLSSPRRALSGLPFRK